MVEEASIHETDTGKVPATQGWFVLHTSEAAWMRSPRFGDGCVFEGPEARFGEVGVNVRRLEPGTPACLYHSEGDQEDFLVLAGACTLVIEEQERALRAGDFVHCPPWTKHVFVGAGDEPCVLIAIGRRSQKKELLYPVSDVAAKYGASAEQETSDPCVAYGPREMAPVEPPWPLWT